jgi:hypothetical protein
MTKAGNDSAESSSRGSSASADATLSAHVFSNPREFLQVLQKDFADINKTELAGITKKELDTCASACSDPDERAAAQIAGTHFDQLHNLSGPLNVTFETRQHDGNPVITKTDVRYGLAFFDQETATKFKHDLKVETGIETFTYSALGTVSSAAGAVGLIVPEPILTKAAGAIFAGFGAAFFYDVRMVRKRAEAARNSLSNESDPQRKMIEGWQEFADH